MAHMSMVTASGRKSSGKKGKVTHMRIEPSDNKGFSTYTHREMSDADKKKGMYEEPEHNVHADAQAMMKHVGETFGAKMPMPAAKPKEQKAEGTTKNMTKDLGAAGEPDEDDD